MRADKRDRNIPKTPFFLLAAANRRLSTKLGFNLRNHGEQIKKPLIRRENQ